MINFAIKQSYKSTIIFFWIKKYELLKNTGLNKIQLVFNFIKLDMKISKERLEKWYRENLPSGRALGYPECCIRAFGNQPPESMKGKPTKDDKRRYKAGCINGVFTGFIPCSEHAKQIVQGKITLQSLIDYGKRDLFIPKFPNA